jgi:hypothetical protein
MQYVLLLEHADAGKIKGFNTVFVAALYKQGVGVDCEENKPQSDNSNKENNVTCRRPIAVARC